MSRLDSVLVVRLSSLGDVLFAVPAVAALRRALPESRLAWLVEDRAAAVLSLVPGLDEVLVFPRRSPAHWLAHAAALRARHDDVVLDLQSNAKSRLQLALLRGGLKVGFDAPLAREGAEHAFDRRVAPGPRLRHRVEQDLAVVAALGLPVAARAPRPELTIPDEARARARALLPTGGPVVVLHPGTSAFGAFKRWPVARFAGLGERLQAQGARLLLTGGPADELLLAPLAAALGSSARRPHLPGLVDLAALLREVDLVVAADSFPLHLANALGTPVVGLYGPKDPAVTGPYFDRAEVVTAGAACSPCTLRRCRDRLCMDELAPEAVAAAALRLLAGRAR